MPVTLEKLLHPQQVVLELRAYTPEESLRELTTALERNPSLREPERFFTELIAREKLHSTAAGDGIAFPHARTDAVDEIVLGIGRSRAGVAFGENKELVHLLFVIGTPRRMISDYLVCIGTLARLLKRSELREELMRASTADEFIEYLQRAAAPAL